MKIRLPLLLLAATFLTASASQADEAAETPPIPVLPESTEDVAEEDWVREALYLGISGVFGVDQISGRLAEETNASNGGGLNVRGGYRMFRYAAFEVEGEWVRKFGSGIEDPYLITANLRFYYPLGSHGRIQPYAVGGVGVFVPNINGKNEVTGAFRVGAGLDFYLTENWSIGPAAEWVSTTSENPALQYISVQFGIQYLFGAGESDGGSL